MNSVVSEMVWLPAVSGDSGAEAYARAAEQLASVDATARDLVQVTEFRTPAVADQPSTRPEGVTLSVVPVDRLVDRPQRVTVQYTVVPGGGGRVVTPHGVVTTAGGVVYLPGITPPNPAASFADQYRACLTMARDMLEPLGFGLEHLVHTTDYTGMVTRAEYPRCGRPRRDLLGGTGIDGQLVFPGAAGILVPTANGPAVRLDAIASTEPLRTVNPGWSRYDTLTYRPGVLAGELLFLSGFAALDPATQRAFPGDLVAQADYIYAAITEVLHEAGTDGRSVVRLVEYVTPAAAESYAELDPLRHKYFPGGCALTSVVCSGLLRPEFQLEVVPTAVLR
ncbi:RidA family protein [Nocardia brasiliensis]|uniref:RidA family protein n=1 Tax=Nocardia brasiliensis TaxID=37326 RepID=UPI0036729F95